MLVTVDVKGGDTHEVDLEALSRTVSDGTRPTYRDVLREIDLSPHEVGVLVDGRPVPEDQPVESDRVTVLRMIQGG